MGIMLLILQIPEIPKALLQPLQLLLQAKCHIPSMEVLLKQPVPELDTIRMEGSSLWRCLKVDAINTPPSDMEPLVLLQYSPLRYYGKARGAQCQYVIVLLCHGAGSNQRYVCCATKKAPKQGADCQANWVSATS